MFDVKMDFTRKARFCAGGHTTDAPDGITYLSVVSRDSVLRLGFLAAALHDVDILSINLENACLNAPCAEMTWFEGTAECGDAKGKVCVLVRSLYGLKSSGFSWRQALASVPESVLHKRHNAINYHVVREAVAAKIMVVGKEDGLTNLADLFTKILVADRRNYLCGFLFR